MTGEGLFLLNVDDPRRTERRSQGPKQSNLISVLNEDGTSTEPFGRQKIVMSLLSSCCCTTTKKSSPRVIKRTRSTTTTEDSTSNARLPRNRCHRCENVFQAQKYISKNLLYFKPVQGPNMKQAVYVYATGSNAAMVSVNGNPIRTSGNEAVLFEHGMSWYSGQIMNIGDYLSLTNLHNKTTGTSWKDLHFILVSSNCEIISYPNSHLSPSSDMTNKLEYNTEINTNTTTPLALKIFEHDESKVVNSCISQRNFVPNERNICETSIDEHTSSKIGDKASVDNRDKPLEQDSQACTSSDIHFITSVQAGASVIAINANQTGHEIMREQHAEEEESPMLTLPHFSSSHPLPDIFGHSESHVQDTSASYLSLTHTEPSYDELEQGSAVPLASLSTKEISLLRDEYAPNSFRHSLLSIVLMRKERHLRKAKNEGRGEEDGDNTMIVLPALLRDTVVVMRRKS